MKYRVTLPATAPKAGFGGKGEISFFTRSESFDEFLTDVFNQYLTRDTFKSLCDRSCIAWEKRVTVE
jgi:hypothetical protein